MKLYVTYTELQDYVSSHFPRSVAVCIHIRQDII